LRVLLIDDGAATSRAFQRLCDGGEVGRYIVDRATVPADGFKAIAADEHDVYVVDHHVGTRTGFDLLSWVDAGRLRVPIVFVAGPGDHGSGVTAVGAGATCYILEDTIDSGALEHAIWHAVGQLRALSHLSNAGISVDLDNSTKTRLLSDVAERLRDSATAFLEVVHHSMESDLPASALESFGSVEDGANTLLTIAHDLDDLSMLETGHFQFNTVPFSLSDLLFNLKRAAGRDFGTSGIEVEIADDVPDTVSGDPGRLRLVVARFVEIVLARCTTSHILVNVGVEHWGPGVVTLKFTISATNGSSPGDGTTVLSDEVVIPERVQGVSSDPELLGMPIALETVSRMGGTVTANADSDGAPTVLFTVRLEVEDEGHPCRSTGTTAASMEGLILVVADSIDTRRSIVETLGGAGLRHLVVPNVEAWEASMQANDDEKCLPAMALIDSAADSFDVCDRFNRATGAQVPIVVVVSVGQRGDSVRCRERGVMGYLARPIDPADLVAVITATMSRVASGDTATLVTRHWLREGRPSLHVLVADDSSTNRFLLTRMLENRGHTAETACDGGEAVEAFRQGSFDVVLMDVMMPVMDGFEATRRIRDMHDGTGASPLIVAVSAFSDEGSIERAGQAGMDGFLAKPVDPDNLFIVVEQQRSTELLHAE